MNSLCIILAAESSGKLRPSCNKNLFFGGSLLNTVFFLFSSKFSKIFNALSDSKRFKILTIDSVDKSINISDWIDCWVPKNTKYSRIYKTELPKIFKNIEHLAKTKIIN